MDFSLLSLSCIIFQINNGPIIPTIPPDCNSKPYLHRFLINVRKRPLHIMSYILLQRLVAFPHSSYKLGFFLFLVVSGSSGDFRTDLLHGFSRFIIQLSEVLLVKLFYITLKGNRRSAPGSVVVRPALGIKRPSGTVCHIP